MFKFDRKESTTVIVCEMQPGVTRTARQLSVAVSQSCISAVLAVIETASPALASVILLEDAQREPTFEAVASKQSRRLLHRVNSYFDDAERGIVLNDCAKVERLLRADKIILVGAAASVHEVAATLFIAPEQTLEIRQRACSGKITFKEIMRQRRRSGRNLATGFLIAHH